MELVFDVILALNDGLGGKEEETFKVALLGWDALLIEVFLNLWQFDAGFVHFVDVEDSVLIHNKRKIVVVVVKWMYFVSDASIHYLNFVCFMFSETLSHLVLR